MRFARQTRGRSRRTSVGDVGWVLRTFASGGLGLAAALLVACGSSNGLLSADQSSTLRDALAGVQSACANGDQDGAGKALDQLRSKVARLKGTAVDAALVQNLQDDVQTLSRQVPRTCGAQASTTTTTTTPPPATTAPTTTTGTGSTQPTGPSTTSTGQTTPPATQPAPGSGNGNGGNENGGGNGGQGNGSQGNGSGGQGNGSQGKGNGGGAGNGNGNGGGAGGGGTTPPAGGDSGGAGTGGQGGGTP